MAAATLPLRTDAGPSVAPAVFHRALLAEHDFADSRYPSPRTASMPIPDASRSYSPQHAATAPPDVQSLKSNQSQEPPRSVVSYALPPGAARRVVERYSLEDTGQQRAPSRASAETRPTALESNQDPAKGLVRQSPSQELPASLLPSAPRHPALPALGVGASSSRSNAPNFAPPIMPLSASPGYNPPVSPNPRAYAQQPTYITPPAAPNPVVPPQEEVCVECAMRDQDMIDVDVTTPGVWERESDVMFDELMRRELEDEVNGVVADDPSRPRARGGMLTEQNLKVWLSVNPREPASRQQTLNTYIKSQRTLLEAEALARARAMQEAKQLDNRMRDTYSQLRRSAYDTGVSAAPADDSGGVRIKPPRSPASPNHPARSHSREVTLLENGMIVEHVDVRKEEKEARERRRKEEKRARKSSRSSVIDVNSIISAQSFNPNTDSGVGLKPYSRYSQASSARPTSVLTAPIDRSDLPRAYSQASFSDIHSLGSASPRRTRFFGMKNLSAGWRSQDSLAPSGISGSMMDMHVALQNEAYGQRVSSPIDLNTARRSQLWPAMDQDAQQPVQEKAKKKKKGFAKIWGIVTGSSKHQNSGSREPSQSYERNEDDGPLAPPPPLSYLVNRGRASEGARHASTPSLPSSTSPKLGLSSTGMSPPTAPSSILPSPASSRGPDTDAAEQRKSDGTTYDEEQHPSDDTIGRSQTVGTRNVHPVTSEPDMRRASQSPTPMSGLSNGGTRPPRPDSVMSFRDKSLPPLPMEAFARPPEARPRTMMSFNARPPPGSGPAHDFLPPQAPFRTSEVRRQSFGGLSSRPALALQTVPVMQPVAFDHRRPFGPRYDEYGLSRRSLGRLDNVQEHPAARSPAPSATKRRSRFGLSSLLGKKPSQNKVEAVHDGGMAAQNFPAMRRSGSEGADDVANGYATSTSRHSAFSMGGPRMSVTSRKALEDLVAQDPDFVAYRYPSANDQHLDILR